MPRRSFALLAVLLVAGCTDQPQPQPLPTATAAVTTAAVTTAAVPSPTPVACSLGEVRFGPVEQSYQLTEISPPTTITAPRGGPIDQPKKLLRRPRAEVRAGAEVPHEYVYQQFSDLNSTTDEYSIADYGTEYQPAPRNAVEVGGPGKFVEFRALRMIEATFTYECGGATSHGSVTTWRPGSHSGLLDCDAPGNSPDPKLRAMFRAAVKLRC